MTRYNNVRHATLNIAYVDILDLWPSFRRALQKIELDSSIVPLHGNL